MADEAPVKKLTLDEAMALLDKQAAEEAANTKKKEKEKVKVKDLLKEGAKQGRAGLGIHTRDLLDQIDD